MTNENTFIQQYLSLMNATPAKPPSLHYLAELQSLHIESFAWNTVDVHFGKRVTLDPHAILDKFITKQKGGLCYELNGAFCYLLQQLGFDAHLATCFALNYHADPFDFPSDTHAIIIVKLEDVKYLVEVGYGDLFKSPIKIEDNSYYQDNSGQYRIIYRQDLNRYQLEMQNLQNWVPQYHFATTPRELSSFHPNLEVVYQHPTYQQLNYIKFSKNGTQILKDNHYIVRHNNKVEAVGFETLGGIETILKEKLGFISL